MKKFFLPLFLIATNALAGNYLTQEMETLRMDLSSDDPARRELTLRLADMYFDLSIKDDPENTSIKIDREKSLTFYQEALKGEDGFKPIEGEIRLKVIFQTARLQDKLGQKDKAELLFKELYANAGTPRNLKLESTLFLGELYEDRAKLNDAIKFYQESINLCTSIDTCNFAHYRLGWSYFKATQLESAINEIKLALWDAKAQLRDQAVNDLISFMSQRQTDGTKELKQIEEIIKKSKNQALMAQMAETFYLAGNREAGSVILSYINKKNPTLLNEIRLLEESYGFRKWEDVEKYLTVLSRRSYKDLPASPEDKSEAIKIHRRLVVQLDAEVEMKPELVDYLKRSIDLYLGFYPNDEMKTKMQEGWLKAEQDNEIKIKRLGLWIDEAIKTKSAQIDINNLRRTRLSLAQKQMNSDVVIIEAKALAASAQGTSDRREYEYVAAFELNKLKKTTEAETLFNKIVKESMDSNLADQWMIQSQNLLLDNFNSRKDYSSIITAVNLWTNFESFKEKNELKDEFAQMKVIATEASFQQAVAQGESKDSLEYFFKNCRENVLVPQSCENAKVLSVKLKDQVKLVALLEMSKDESALVNEYELMGRFGDAARLREKMFLKSHPTVTEYLKVSLLYELDLNFDQRNRVLAMLVNTLRSAKNIDSKYEKIIYATLVEAAMIDNKILSLGWSLPFKMKLAQTIHQNQSDMNTRKLLLSQKTYQGAVWSRTVLDEVQKMDMNLRKVSFYGGNSKAMFKKKASLLTQLEANANSYLEGSDSETRVYLISMMQKSNFDFAQEIINTPIPADLDVELVSQVKASLDEMAAPFIKSHEDYTKLLNDEILAIEDKALAQKVTANLALSDTSFSSFIQTNEEVVTQTSKFDYSGRIGDISKLMVEPTSSDALASLEKFYINNKSERIASYFKERIQLLKN